MYSHKPTLEASWICLDDVASLMVAALKTPEKFIGRNIPVGGAETVRPGQLAEKLSRAWGRDLKYEELDLEEFGARMRGAMPGGKTTPEGEKLIAEVQGLYRYFNDAPDEPFKVDMGPVLKELPCTLTPIEEWGRRKRPGLVFKGDKS